MATPATPSTPTPVKPLRRAAVRRLLKAEPCLGLAERACAVLLSDGAGEAGINALAGLTPAQVRDLAGSIRARVMRNDQRVFRARRMADADRKKREAQQRKQGAGHG